MTLLQGDAYNEDVSDMDVGVGGDTLFNAGADGNVAGAAGARLWLVPLLRQALRGARVSYFAEEMMPVARRLGDRAAKAKAWGSLRPTLDLLLLRASV
jgi:hypothetical protein